MNSWHQPNVQQCQTTSDLASAHTTQPQLYFQPAAQKPRTRSNAIEIPLREWIDGAIRSADTSDNPLLAFGADPILLALKSDSFLASALKIAWSLADYLSQAEEPQNAGEYQLPTPCSNWADHITVRLPSCDNELADSHSIPPNPSTNKSKPSFLSVTIAQFSSSSNYDSDSGSLIVKNQRIYSLGLVLHEIFSGGELPTQKSKDGNSKQAASSGKGSINISRALNIFDDIGDIDDIFEEDDRDEEEIDEPHPKKKSTQKEDEQNFAASSGSLKEKGIPGPLCEMIANMLESINGDLCGHEAYSHMSDVVGDLRLMLDKPNRFLHDLDIEKLSMTGLQMNERIFGTEAELETLQGSYQRALSGESELAFISGPSGTGKTVLANQVGSYITSCDHIFLSGKFDQLPQPKPYSAMAYAFNEYCNTIIREGKTELVEKIGLKLRMALGKEALHLIRVIPNLRSIIDQDADENDYLNQDWTHGQKRFQYLLCQFVEAISSASGSPVTLFIDDLQYADQASIEAIKQLVWTSGSVSISKQFYFLGCCREEALNDGQPFLDMLKRIRCFGINETRVKLTCMNEVAVNNMLSELLCLFPRITKPLSHLVYAKTKGNPLFISQLIASLCKDGLLRLSLARRQWEWDVEKISSRQISDDVAAFFSSTIKRLPPDVQHALSVLACFGARCDCTILRMLETKLAVSLIQPLAVAAEERLVEKRDNGFFFLHDRIQEVSYQLMPAEERCIHHIKYGIALCSTDFGSLDDTMLFTAVGQVNRAGPSAIVGNAQQSVLMANLNLLAGNRAVGMSDHALSHSFYDHGISFLKKGHWQMNYSLSMQLFNGAAKAAFATGDLVAVKLLSEQVLAFSKSFEDKLDVLYISLCALTSTSRLSESIEKGFSILSQLGEVIPSHTSESEMTHHVYQTNEKLSTFTDEHLLNHMMMSDQKKIIAMKFYRILQTATQSAMPHMQPLITLQMVNLTVSHGLSPAAPIAFAWYGMLLAALGDIRGGYRFAKIAQQLLNKVGKETAGEVIATGTQVICYVEPLQAAVKFHLEGHSAAMLSGDTASASMNSMLYSSTCLWAGEKLHIVQDMVDKTRREMEQNNQLLWLMNFMHLQKTVMMLVSSTKEEADRITALPGEGNLRGENPHASRTLHFQSFYISFVFREYDQMKSHAELYFAVKLKYWNFIFPYAITGFMGGLVSFWVYRKTNNPMWLNRGCEATAEIKKFADTSDWNFGGKLHLLQAEEFYSKNDLNNARASYDKAISSSIEHKFLNDIALACELAGYCCLEQGEQDHCLRYFLQAHENYYEWGACAKANDLFGFVQQNFGPLPCLDSSNEHRPSSSSVNCQNGSPTTRKRESNAFV